MTIERIQLRRGTAQQWTDTDPILGAAEVGVELGTPSKFKIGDGSSTWTELPYFTSGSTSDYILDSEKGAANGVATLDANGAIPVSQLANIINSAPSTLDTLNELAAALGDDANFASTILNAIDGKADISHTHTKSQITDFAHTHTLSNISDVTASASELNILDGATLSTTELNYLDGVTSSIQTQIDGKANSTHTHTKSQITDFSHTHDASEITNTLSTITATTYTIQASDNGKTLILNPTGGSITLTVDNVFSVGQRADVYLKGTSATFVAGTGTIESAGLSMATQYTVASIICISSGVYAIVGNLE